MSSVRVSPECQSLRRGATTPAGEARPLADIRLRRRGQRPLCFKGMLLMEHRPTGPSPLRRHSIRIFENERSRFVIEISLSGPNEDVAPTSIAEEVASLADAAHVLAQYDPAGEVVVPAAIVDGGSTVELARAAANLRIEAQHLVQDFTLARRSLFGPSAAAFNRG